MAIAAAAAGTERSALIDGLNGRTTGAQTGVAEIKDRFLKLLTTQLRNQDPTNPMDNAELTSQLAQMSTVEGINNLNSAFSSLLAGYRASQTLQAASLIGHRVLTDGAVLSLSEGLAGGGVELGGPAESVMVRISDASGGVVRSLDLGAQDAGIVRFGWDGRDAAGGALPDGQYSFQVEAKQGGTAVATTPLTLASVSSVLIDGETFRVELAGLGQATLDKVRQIY